MPSHGCEATEVLRRQDVVVGRGLSEAEAATRHARTGPNRIAPRARSGLGVLALKQLRSPVVTLLAAAAVLAAVFGEVEEAAAITVVLAVNSLIGFVTEARAKMSIEALRALEVPLARVRRDGHERAIPAAELVPGDIVLLEAGDAVPADMRIVEAAALMLDESALTGESAPVGKTPDKVPEAALLADRSSMLFAGTAVTNGTALGVTVATGASTELGRISRLVLEAEPGRSPIEAKLARLASQLIWAVLALALMIFVAGMLTGRDALLMAEAGIALAVAAIPEGLPIVATLALARGMWRMARQNALVEQLSAVETLGATTVILTDKTGTLTENRMTVRRLWLPSGEVDPAEGLRPDEDEQLAALLRVAVLCNDAALGAPDGVGLGDPMELALLRVGAEAGLTRPDLLAEAPQIGKRAFDSRSKMMTTLHRVTGGCLAAVKGAPEAVLHASALVAADGEAHQMTPADRSEWLQRVADLAHHGLRVLAFAERRADDSAQALGEPQGGGLTFLGLVGLEDPARQDVPDAIAACHRAGIRVVMVTGDHAATAHSIGRAVGLRHDPAAIASGAEVGDLTESGGFDRIGIFARVSPEQKLALVRAHQAAGGIVAMTGDGVNDAPALRQADIGVAMGLRGTDVARGAAAMILLDDAFPTIVAAIREGRVIFGNIRRFAAYLLACNLAEVLVVGLAVAATLPLPLLPLQILYLNLVTDVFPAFALALGDGEADVLDNPPRPPTEPILGRREWRRIGTQAALMAAATFAALGGAHLWLGLAGDAAVTVSFLTLAFAQLWQVFNMRARRARMLRNEITRNLWVWGALALCTLLLAVPAYLPGAAGLLGLVPPDAAMWALVLVASVLPVLIWQMVLTIAGPWRG